MFDYNDCGGRIRRRRTCGAARLRTRCENTDHRSAGIIIVALCIPSDVISHPHAKHGPHLFHTNRKWSFEYLPRFTAWRPYEHWVQTSVDGQFVPVVQNQDLSRYIL
jgi:hypothetical protein